jgi:hypothetical protein
VVDAAWRGAGAGAVAAAALAEAEAVFAATRGQVCVNPTQVCVNPTQVCVNLTQVFVNPTQQAEAQAAHRLTTSAQHGGGDAEDPPRGNDAAEAKEGTSREPPPDPSSLQSFPRGAKEPLERARATHTVDGVQKLRGFDDVIYDTILHIRMPQVRVVLRRRPFHLPCEPTSSTFYATRRDLERWRTLFAVSHLAVRGIPQC